MGNGNGSEPSLSVSRECLSENFSELVGSFLTDHFGVETNPLTNEAGNFGLQIMRSEDYLEIARRGIMAARIERRGQEGSDVASFVGRRLGELATVNGTVFDGVTQRALEKIREKALRVGSETSVQINEPLIISTRTHTKRRRTVMVGFPVVDKPQREALVQEQIYCTETVMDIASCHLTRTSPITPMPPFLPLTVVGSEKLGYRIMREWKSWVSRQRRNGFGGYSAVILAAPRVYSHKQRTEKDKDNAPLVS